MVSEETIYWTSTEHLLPDDGLTVLAKTKKNVFESYYQKGEWRIYGVLGPKTLQNKVTWWARMPSGPK